LTQREIKEYYSGLVRLCPQGYAKIPVGRAFWLYFAEKIGGVLT